MGDIQCACSCLLLCILSLFSAHRIMKGGVIQEKFLATMTMTTTGEKTMTTLGGDYDNDNDFGGEAYSPGAVSTCAYIHTHDNN